MITRFAPILTGANLLLVAPLSLAATEQTTAKTLTTPPVSTTALLETLGGLFLILGLIIFLAWLLRRTGRFQMTPHGEMKIISSLALGPRERAVLLQVGNKQLVVGVTAHTIQTLHILEENIESPSSEPLSSGFAKKLHTMMQANESKK